MLGEGISERDLSRLAMARYLGITQGKMIAWKDGQWPAAADLAVIAERLGFSYRWLVTGEGDPHADEPSEKDAGQSQADAARIAALEAELRERERELLEARAEIIALYRERAATTAKNGPDGTGPAG